MESLRPSLRVAQATHTGNVRSNNEDAFGWFSVPAGELILVADGIGGNVGGEVASQCAVKAFSEAMQRPARSPGAALSQALLYADCCVQNIGKEHPELRGCGTTLAALLLTPTSAWHIHAGDSRVYRFSRGELKQLGRDHSAVQEMLAAGQITEAQAKAAPKNVITQSLGGNVNANYCKPEEIPYGKGDKFLLCTDGLWGMVEERGIKALLQASPDVNDNVDALLQAALEAGGADNVTLQVVECLSGKTPLLFFPSLARASRPSKILVLAVSCILLMVLLLGGYAVWESFFGKEELPQETLPSQNTLNSQEAPPVAPKAPAQPEAGEQKAGNTSPAPQTESETKDNNTPPQHAEGAAPPASTPESSASQQGAGGDKESTSKPEDKPALGQSAEPGKGNTSPSKVAPASGQSSAKKPEKTPPQSAAHAQGKSPQQERKGAKNSKAPAPKPKTVNL